VPEPRVAKSAKSAEKPAAAFLANGEGVEGADTTDDVGTEKHSGAGPQAAKPAAPHPGTSDKLTLAHDDTNPVTASLPGVAANVQHSLAGEQGSAETTLRDEPGSSLGLPESEESPANSPRGAAGSQRGDRARTAAKSVSEDAVGEVAEDTLSGRDGSVTRPATSATEHAAEAAFRRFVGELQLGAVEARTIEPASTGPHRQWAAITESADAGGQLGGDSTISTEPIASGRGMGESSLHAADRARFTQRLMHALHAAEARGGQVRLRLNPPELGSLRLELAVRDGAVSARMEVENSAARTLLLDSLPQLRERLAAQEIKIERFEVDLMNQHSSDWSQRARDESHAGNAGFGFRPASDDDLAAAVASVAEIAGQYVDAEGINVLV
jgi:flagellar hook-length control protein FliK